MHAILATIAAIAHGAGARTDCIGSEDDPDQSILDAIYNPLTAAAVMLVAVAKASGPISDETANLIRDELQVLTGQRDVTELLVFSGWITEFNGSPDMIAQKFSALWRRALSRAKRRLLVDAASNVAASCKTTRPAQLDALHFMRERLC